MSNSEQSNSSKNINQTKSNENILNESKSKVCVENYIDNSVRYNEVMKVINKFIKENDDNSKLITKKSLVNKEEENAKKEEDNNKNITNNDDKSKKIDENKRIKELKDKLMNVNNDEENIYNFINHIDDILSSRKYEFNDKIFEETVTNMFIEKYELTQFNAFRWFNFGKSKDKGDFMSIINFNKITIEDEEKKEYIFFNDREYFPIQYKDMLFLFEKNKEGVLNIITIFYHDFKYESQDIISKVGQIYQYPIFKKQIDVEFLEKEQEKNKLKCELIDLNENKKDNKIKITEKENQLKKLQEEQNKIFDIDIEKKKFYNDIKKFDKNNHVVLITIEKLQKEFDGFYRTEKEIEIKNKSSSIKIPSKSFILVEVKNHKKYDEIYKNIKSKIILINKLGINHIKNNLFFIGIINDFDEKKYNDKIIENKKDNIFILTENDIKKNEKQEIYINYSITDEIKNELMDIKTQIRDIKDTLDEIKSFIQTIKPFVKKILASDKESKNENDN